MVNIIISMIALDNTCKYSTDALTLKVVQFKNACYILLKFWRVLYAYTTYLHELVTNYHCATTSVAVSRLSNPIQVVIVRY